MEIRIAVQHVAREIAFETEVDQKAIMKQCEAAIASNGVLQLTDDKGRVYVIPAAQIGFIEIGEQSARKVGFGTT